MGSACTKAMWSRARSSVVGPRRLRATAKRRRSVSVTGRRGRLLERDSDTAQEILHQRPLAGNLPMDDAADRAVRADGHVLPAAIDVPDPGFLEDVDELDGRRVARHRDHLALVVEAIEQRPS